MCKISIYMRLLVAAPVHTFNIDIDLNALGGVSLLGRDNGNSENNNNAR